LRSIEARHEQWLEEGEIIEISTVRQSFGRLESFGGFEKVVEFSKKQVAGNCRMFACRPPGVQQRVTFQNVLEEPTE
jgi:hypothetical protein